MVVELSEKDYRAIEDHLGEIKALVVRLRMGTDQQKAENKEDLLSSVTYQANSIINLLHNGLILTNEENVELSR